MAVFLWVRRGAWLACVAGALLGSGCSGIAQHAYSLHTEFAWGAEANSRPQVVTSPTGATLTARARTVGLRAPDNCSGESAAQSEGDAESQSVILEMRCGPAMAELERALVRQGYRVIHWTAVEQYARRGEVTAEAAAERMGLDLVINVNSLERASSMLRTHADWQRSYLHADPFGEERGPATVAAGLADVMDAYLAAQEERISQEAWPSVTIDITTQQVPTSESVWFYRWTAAYDPGNSQGFHRRFYVLCSRPQRNGPFTCAHAVPRPRREPIVDGRPPRDGSARTVTLNASDADVRRRIHAQLIRTTMDDVARRFRHGADAEAPAPAAATAPAVPGTAAPAAPGAVAPARAGTPSAPAPAVPPSSDSAAPSWLSEP